MKITITGIAGFIGSNLAARLLQEGHSVTGIDNFSYGFARNMNAFIRHPSFSFLEDDVAGKAMLKCPGSDTVVHLASQKIPRYSNAMRTLDENLKMLQAVADKCIHDKSKLVFASTSDVYGKQDIPLSETCDLVMGSSQVKRWAYAVSKIFSEQYIAACHAGHGMEYTIMRFFGSYGKNQNTTWWGGPQAVFIQNIIEGKALELHGDGLQTRTFTYIDDLIDGIMKCIFHPRSSNEIFNIAGSPEEEISIKNLAGMIWKMMKGNSHPPLRYIPYSDFGRYEDARRRVPSIDKIKQLLGYAPAWNLEEGLKKTIEWQRGIIS